MIVVQEALSDQPAGSANFDLFRVQHYMTDRRFIYFNPMLS